MDTNEKATLYNEVMATFGYTTQVHKAIEEMAELTDVLMKNFHGRAKPEQIITEIADVVICMEELALHFGVKEVYDEKERKIQRLAERLKEYKDKLTADDNAAPSDSPS